MKKVLTAILALFIATCALFAARDDKAVALVNLTPSSNRACFGVEQLEKALADAGYTVTRTATISRSRTTIVVAQYDASLAKKLSAYKVTMPEGIAKEGFHIRTSGKTCFVLGVDGNGALYGCREIIDRLRENKTLSLPANFTDAPEMVLRGTCIGLQKPYYLPGRTVYEYPYTEDVFPWFYDKEMWIDYLDMLVENRMNSVYLWNGHPFASLVKLKDYPFAVEVDDATFEKNKDMFSFITNEADKRGIFVIQMFYNIIVSKPFAEHYGIKTQDRNRPIIDYIADYTRKSIAAFIENYPNVGLLACLGEAMATQEDDVEWFTKVVIPGVKDGLKALGRTDEPPLLLRAHDTNCKMVMDAALPLYKNLYTMHKYNGESLTTYEPRGPWAEIHRGLSALGSIHIENVHILANLEPFRWGSPLFVQKTVKAMHEVHGANALHLYPQASYWDFPYTADRLPDGSRLLQIDRDWIWYKVWGRYAWKDGRDRGEETDYWSGELADKYGCGKSVAEHIMNAYDEAGEIAPKLIRRFGITEGNRETLLLGLTMPELVTPYKFTIYPGFYESCGPVGEKLVEWVEKEVKGQPHIGELPLDIIEQCVRHGSKAIAEIEAAAPFVTQNKAEFERLRNDMYCYYEFASFMHDKVLAAKEVLLYGHDSDISHLGRAIAPLESSLDHFRRLSDITDSTYYYANSMHTSQRRIPISGANGKNKTWRELLVHYQQERDNFVANYASLLNPSGADAAAPAALRPADVALEAPASAVYVPVVPGNDIVSGTVGRRTGPATSSFDGSANLNGGVLLEVAPELAGMKAIVLKPSESRAPASNAISFTNAKAVNLIVGYFNSEDRRIARAPKLETDASADEYGQADVNISNAATIEGMPTLDTHVYTFAPGKHELRLPIGQCVIFGFTEDSAASRDAGLGASFSGNNLDALFY